MYEVSRFGPVVRIRMSRALLGRPLQWVHAFWVDGLLIDSGCAHTRPDLQAAITTQGLVVEQLVNTHSHEDHVAGNGWVTDRFGVRPRAHPLALDRLARPLSRRDMQSYRRFFWGLIDQPSLGEPAGRLVETDHYRFQLIHTPGHADDHLALFEERMGWLFSGDLLISPTLQAVRACEEPRRLMQSLRQVAALPVRQLFCSHAYRVAPGAQPLLDKVGYWESLQAKARQVARTGLSVRTITRRLLPGGEWIERLTAGDYGRIHLIAGLLREGSDDPVSDQGWTRFALEREGGRSWMDRAYLKHYPEGVRWGIEFPEVPAYSFLFEQIKRVPDRTALIFVGKKISYRELGDQIDRFGAALQRRYGIKKGDRVGIILPNCPQNVIATVACQRIGAVPVQFNPLYVTREIEYQVKDSGCRIMIALDLLWNKVREAGGAEAYIWTGIQDYLPFPLGFLFKLKTKPPQIGADQATHFMELLKEPAANIKVAPINPHEDLAVLLYTGGTTGVSKGVMLTHFNITSNIIQIQEWLHRGDKHDTVLVALPLFHSYGFTAALGLALGSGSTCVLIAKPEPGELLKAIAKWRPTSFPGVPTMYTGLLNHPKFAKYDISSIDYCVSGAAPMPVELMKRFEELSGGNIMEGYGLTECSPVTHANPLKGVRKPGSVGLPYPGTDYRIIDLETGADLGPDQEGEVLIRGPQVMKGYWNKPDETAAVLVDGWLFTGDIGRMDADGYLYLVDRKKDMVISGGFNVYPREIDEVLYQHPAVKEALSVGVPDEYRGESVKAFVVLKEGMTATPQEILDFCKERLAAYKRPREVEFLPELPKSAVGKALRRVLADREREKARIAVGKQ